MQQGEGDPAIPSSAQRDEDGYRTREEEEARRRRIYAQSAKVGEYVRRSAKAQAAYACFGTPDAVIEPPT